MDGIQGLISIRQRPLSLQVSAFNTQERVRPRHSERVSGIQLNPPENHLDTEQAGHWLVIMKTSS